MEWNRSETIGLASATCVFCRGLGQRKTSEKGEVKTCKCVFRAIFRACYTRYRHCMELTGRSSQMSLESTNGPIGYRIWGRRNEEYLADFEKVSRRHLAGVDQQIFNLHYIDGADWKVCTAKLGIDKGTFFHSIYRIQEHLGRIYRELEPYSLFPLDEYFTSHSRNSRATQKPSNVIAMPARTANVLSRRRRRLPKAA
jgi:hypothetical protein